MGSRITVTGVLTGEFSFERPAYAGFGRMETVNIYKITDNDGKVYVWKTTSSLGHEIKKPYDYDGNVYYRDKQRNCSIVWEGVDKGDTFTFTASIKDETVYKGEPQTELQRVKVVDIIDSPVKRAEENKRAKKQAQLDSIKGDDFIWDMPYSQYKAHYADCETVIDSYDDHADEWDRYGDHFGNPVPTISVIIREGRLKASGVRGKHFHGFEIEFTNNGEYGFSTYRAVSTENAIKQAQKDFPNAEGFKCRRIYD